MLNALIDLCPKLLLDLHDSALKNVPTNLCRVHIGREPSCHLLPWVNVVSEIAQMLTELMHIFLNVTQLLRNIGCGLSFGNTINALFTRSNETSLLTTTTFHPSNARYRLNASIQGLSFSGHSRNSLGAKTLFRHSSTPAVPFRRSMLSLVYVALDGKPCPYLSSAKQTLQTIRCRDAEKTAMHSRRRSENQMIENRDVHKSTRFHEFTRQHQIFFRWRRISRRMVVRNNDTLCALFQRCFKNKIWLQSNLITLPPGNFTRHTNHPVPRPQKDDKEQLLIVTINKRHEQIVCVFRRVNISRIVLLRGHKLRVRTSSSNLYRRDNLQCFCFANSGDMLGYDFLARRTGQGFKRPERNQ